MNIRIKLGPPLWSEKDNRMDSRQLIEAEKQYLLGTYTRPPFVITHGKDGHLFDSDGKAYLDFVAGIAVNALGYGDELALESLEHQARKLWHCSNLYYTEPQVRLAKMLIAHTFADKVFFCNSGTEAIEAAIKIARKWARVQKHRSAYEIVAMHQSFHGRTYGALSATGQPALADGFEPMLAGFVFAEFNNLASVRDKIGPHTGAILLEPVQGEGGINPATGEFMKGLRDLCNDQNCLLILDEIQCGLGRTGTFCAYEQYGITPDVMAIAKPLAGGLPMGALLLTDHVAAPIQAGSHGTTFGGGPLVSAVAESIVSRLCDERHLAHVREMGAYLNDQMIQIKREYNAISEVRAKGLMIGLELTIDPQDLISACMAAGLLICKTGSNAVRLLPPQNVQKQHIDEAAEKLREALNSLET
jgi:predicted acetylornithine/succinylornithine family transaminase